MFNSFERSVDDRVMGVEWKGCSACATRVQSGGVGDGCRSDDRGGAEQESSVASTSDTGDYPVSCALTRSHALCIFPTRIRARSSAPFEKFASSPPPLPPPSWFYNPTDQKAGLKSHPNSPCLLDIYVSTQRAGHGRVLFSHVLERSGLPAGKWAYDRPSFRLPGFLRKGWGLEDGEKQSNGYMVFGEFFDRDV